MLNKEIKYGLNDISIMPAPYSTINSRSECNVYDKNKFLPLFTAPMNTVVDEFNYSLFNDNNIYSILPRTVELSKRKDLCKENWCAFSLVEFKDMITSGEFDDNILRYVLIDTANGNMISIYEAIKSCKYIYGENVIIMAGNIANPETYELLSEAGANYLRVGVGGGKGCLTSSNTSIHFPMASLIDECFKKSLTLKNPAYIVADGGIRNYSDIIKCLALGADYVMVGSVFNKMLESAGITTIDDNVIDQYSEEALTILKGKRKKLYKVFYGMSTKRAQSEMGNKKLKTSEGIERVQEVEYSMSQWGENFEDYLKSAMSYTNSRDLDDFIGEVETIVISPSAQNAINK